MSKFTAPSSFTKREIPGRVGGATAATLTAGIAGQPALTQHATDQVEAIAINILADAKRCFCENFDGFSLTKLDRTHAEI